MAPRAPRSASLPRDSYDLPLTTSRSAASSYNEGVAALLKVQAGGLETLAASITIDPTFALGHAALALLGHEYCAAVDIEARITSAQLLAGRATTREQRHVHAVVSHIRGDSAPLISHLVEYPLDALLLSVAVPTIAFAGVTTVPQESWAIVESAQPSYGMDWWYCGLLAFVRQEQGRWDDAMRLSCASLDVEPAAGHSVHARTHVHYETGDNQGGLDWLDAWIHGPGTKSDNLAHYSWHAALHELAMGDFDAVRSRYAAELAPPAVVGCRALVDSCSLLWRWAITPGAESVPGVATALDALDDHLLDRPPTAFMAMHSVVTLCALEEYDRLAALQAWARDHEDATFAEVVSPLAAALRALGDGDASTAADRLAALSGSIWRLGGSDAQREIVEDTLVAALLAAARFDEARALIDRRLDRRVCRRDLAFLAATTS